jgi:hypothetical protein
VFLPPRRFVSLSHTANSAVIAGLDPAIHAATVPFTQACLRHGNGMDARIKSGHDGVPD